MKVSKRGITLIALIITVIVLLILAGTAVSIAINGGDIFNKATEAKEGWNAKVAEEEQNIIETLQLANGIITGNNGGAPTPAQTTYPAYTVGQRVSIGTEEFYVLEDSDNTQSTVTLLAKYNLNQAGTEQAPNASYEDTACAFSSTYYWEAVDNAFEDWVNSYPSLNNISGYSDGDAMAKAKNYAKLVTNDASNNTGRLPLDDDFTREMSAEMTKGEGINGNRQGEGSSDYFLVYWLGDSADDGEIWFRYGTNSLFTDNMSGTGTTGYDGLYHNDTLYIGVRPVLTAPKTIVTVSST